MLGITVVSPIQLQGETSHLLQTGNETNHTAQGDTPKVQVAILYLNVRLDGVVQLLLMALGHNVGQNPGKTKLFSGLSGEGRNIPLSLALECLVNWVFNRYRINA